MAVRFLLCGPSNSPPTVLLGSCISGVVSGQRVLSSTPSRMAESSSEYKEQCPRQLRPNCPFQATHRCREAQRPLGDGRNTVLTSNVSSLTRTDAERKRFLFLVSLRRGRKAAIPHSAFFSPSFCLTCHRAEHRMRTGRHPSLGQAENPEDELTDFVMLR